MSTTLFTFDIREHIDRLTPSKKGKNYYECPVCQGSSLSIDPKSGKFKCWSGDCESASIREAIRPWSEARGGAIPSHCPTSKKASRQQPKLKVAPIPANLRLLQLAEPAWDCPAPEPIDDELWKIVRGDKKVSGRSRSALTQTAYCYGNGKKVYRIEWPDETNPKGHDKTYRQSRVDNDGKRVWKKGDGFWPAYCINEIVETLEDVGVNEAVAVLGLEGEPNVELARSHGIAALTFQGSNWTEAQVVAVVESLRATGKNVTLVILRDNDTTGIKKAELIKSVCDRLQFPCIVIDPVSIHPNIPEKGDIKEILDAMDADEFIRRLEEEIHRQVAESARAGELEKGEEKDAGERPDEKPPTPRKVAAQIKEDYGHQWKFDNEQKTWRVWNGKYWEKIEIGAFTSLVKTTLDARNISYRGSAYIEDVKKLLEHDLRQVSWQAWDKTQYINFSNCVLDGQKNKTLEHSPGTGFISCLPYNYQPLQGDLGDSLKALSVNCPKIFNFFYEAMNGDKRKMFKLLAIINALLKRRFFDLQMFVHIIGQPGSGKGKFARLCQKLVGKDNSIGCQLERLTDGSTKASLIDKQLVVFPDERKPVGIDSILSLTGGDVISYRELHTPAASAYFYGSLLICSNKPIFIGDTTGLERRLCLIDFNNPVDEDKRDHSLEAELDAEIPALITIAISLLDSAVTQAIRGTGTNQIMEFKLKEWEMKIETDSIAAFFDTELVLANSTTTPTSKLYEAYKTWCENSGLKPFSLTKFPRHLSELLNDQKLPAKWYKARTSTFDGLRLRSEHDEHLTYSQSLESLAPLASPLCTTSAPLDAPLEGIHSKGLHHLHHLEGELCEEKSNQLLIPPTTSFQDAIVESSRQPKENIPLSGASGANFLPASITSGAEVVQDTPSSGVRPPEPETVLTPLTPLTTQPAQSAQSAQSITPSELETTLTAQPELQTAPFPIDGQAIRRGQWISARAIAWNEEGTQLVVKYVRASGDMGEMLVFPERFAPTEPIAFPAPETAPASASALEPELEIEPIAFPVTPAQPTDTSSEAQPELPEPDAAETITPEDAEKMREIALVWWPELYHPETLQSLVTQMFGWNAPADKYSAVQIAQWLQREDELVKYRIGEIMAIGLADNCEADAEE